MHISRTIQDSRVHIGRLSNWMGKTFKMSFKGENLINDSETQLAPGAHLPPPRGNIHVYYHSIQTSSSLKPVRQSKSNFIWSIYRKGESTCIKIIQVKMSGIPIYGKKPFKIFFFGTGGPMSMKLDSSMPQVLQCIYKSGPKGKTCRKLANEQDIDYSEEKKAPRLHLPLY